MSSAVHAARRDGFYQRIFETTPLPVWVLDDRERTLLVNASMSALLGYRADEMLGRPLLDFFDATARDRAGPLLGLCPHLEQTHALALSTRAGNLLALSFWIDSLPISEAETERGWVLIADCAAERRRIDELSRTCEALRESEARARILLDQNTDLTLLLGPQGAITFASRSVEEILGYTPEGIAALDPINLIHPEDRLHAKTALDGLVSGVESSRRLRFRVRHRSGSFRVLDAHARSLLANPAIRAVAVNARDVTDRDKLEEQLSQARKLESIGRLAGGVAHDFNNLLTAILGYTSLLEEKVVARPADLEDVREIRRAAERASELTGQLLAFAGKRLIAPRSLHLPQLIAKEEGFLRRVLGESIELLTDLERELWSVRADPTQIEQLISSLALNARDAMPRGGKFCIRGHNVTLDEAFTAAHAGLDAGAYVRLEVRDTGEGMPEEVLPHVFEPFYTTKTRGHGTGLGLATVYGIVRQNGGHIEVESSVGIGTTFHIHFPRCRELPLPLPVLDEGEARSPGRERILLVEDDDTVRRFALRALSKAGYQVQSASRPLAALELVHAGSVPFDLLLTDVMMPGMTGKELADRLLAIAPALRVLYMSGYAQDAIAHQGILDPDIEFFLAKPFTQANLCQRVREVLERA